MRRSAILDDGYAALRNVGSSIKGRLSVSFVNVHGEMEAGLDHGGLVKEFLEEVTRSSGLQGRDLLSRHCAGKEGHIQQEVEARAYNELKHVPLSHKGYDKW